MLLLLCVVATSNFIAGEPRGAVGEAELSHLFSNMYILRK